MELLKDIYFNTDKLVENTNVKVSYTGKFYQGDNDKVFIHYGYGKNWDNIQEVEMKKTDLGYQTELNLAGNETINFCFKNQSNEWDNNYGKNYVFNIEKATVNDLGATTVGTPEIELDSAFGGANFDNIVTPTATELNSIINPISELTSNDFDEANNIYSPVEEIAKAAGVNSVAQTAEPITSLAVKNNKNKMDWSGTINWAKKVKASVVKFFASVPKFISGNYKRNVNKKSK